MSEPKPKSFEISKRAVWEAYRRVKANKGGAGVDGECWAPFNLGKKRASRAVHGGDEPLAAQDGVGVVVVGVQHE